MSYDLLYMIIVVISNLTNFLPDFDMFKVPEYTKPYLLLQPESHLPSNYIDSHARELVVRRYRPLWPNFPSPFNLDKYFGFHEATYNYSHPPHTFLCK